MDDTDLSDAEHTDGPSILQLDLARRIIDRIRDADLTVGTRISAPELARLFGVSRSPIAGALDLLVEKGVLQPMEKRGLRVARDVSTLDLAEILPVSPIEDLYRRMLRERAQDTLPQDVSEAELMPRYGVSRGTVRKLLMRFAAEGLAQRLPGHGWRFVDSLVGDDAYRESYEFRAIVECSALRTPHFKVDKEIAAQIRRSHERIIDDPASRSGSDEWFRVNAFFHENLAGFSGNRFLTEFDPPPEQPAPHAGIGRFFELPAERIEQSCREHLAILDAVENGDLDWAEALLRQHLKQALEFGTSERV